MTRTEYIEKKKRQLDRWGHDMDELEAKAKKSGSVISGKSNDLLTSVRGKYHAVAGKLESIKEATEESWKSVKADTENVWVALKDSVSEFRKHFKKV